MQYVHAMDYKTLCKPLNHQQMFEQLNIENPIVVLLVDHWMRVRRNRMEQEQMLMDKIKTAKELFADLQSAPEEALWEDVEEVDDD